jgi:hypothetical protein
MFENAVVWHFIQLPIPNWLADPFLVLLPGGAEDQWP